MLKTEKAKDVFFMTESARRNTADKMSRVIVRLFFVVLAFLLLQAGWDHYAPLVLGNDKPLTAGGASGLLYFRDRRLDRLQPTVTRLSDSAFTAAEIDAAANALKERFKLQKITYGLCGVRFDEAASRRLLAQVPAPDDGGRYLALLCDYNVFEDAGADKKGYYPDAVFILRQTPDGAWTFPAESAEQTLLRPLVCPLQQHGF